VSGIPVQLSIVIPCLNEEATLGRAIGFAKDAIALSRMPGEVIVADNGSTDSSVVIAEKLGARVVHVAKRGYGFALIAGFSAARGDYLIMGDADGTYDFREAVVFIADLKNGSDIVMGSRLRGNIAEGAMPFLHRYLGTPVLSRLIRTFFGVQISDCNCGMRALKKSAFDYLAPVSGGMEFASEMIIKAGLYGLKVTERPCSLLVDTRNKPPHLRTWRDGWRHLRFILLFAPHVMFQIPGWTMLILGALVTAAVLPRPLVLFGRIFDFHYLFYSMPVLILGYQALWFDKIEEYYVHFAGYLPRDIRRAQRIKLFPLEVWLTGGALALIAGAGVLAWMFFGWLATGLGAMHHVRLGVLGMLLLILGAQTIMNAMVISMMEIKLDRV
jgi:glycosyltransferase involved in cell wall biosynthesis